MADILDKHLLTWSLRITNPDYRHDFEQYGNKIYSLGFHEWSVDKYGRIGIYDLEKKYGDADPDPGAFYNFNSDPDTGWDATTFNRYAGVRALWPQYIEKDMARWPHIKYYMQFIIFGPNTVTSVLDSKANQDAFISNLIKTVRNFDTFPDGSRVGYAGIELDIEGTMSDSKWDSRVGDDEKYVKLVKRVKDEVIIPHFPHMKLRLNLHAMWGEGVPDYYRFQNYRLVANLKDKNGDKCVDEVQLMTYDMAWAGSAPGPSTPIYWFENVANWCQQCFDRRNNPDSVMEMSDIYFGVAGYGTRYPINKGRDVNNTAKNNNYGSSITYRNLVEWQNGYYKHFYADNKNQTVNQDFLTWAGYNDPVSKNQMLYQHVYDYFAPKFMENVLSMNGEGLALSTYNEIEYATGYSKRQHGQFNGVKAMTGIKGSSEPSTNIRPTRLQPNLSVKRSETAKMPISGQEREFQGYTTKRRDYVPQLKPDGSRYACLLDPEQPETELTYNFNISTAGNYRLVALVSFPFYGYTKLNASLNGESFVIGGAGLPDYYPMMFKAVHGMDLGTKSFKAGTNTIKVLGSGSEHGTIIFGFVVCEEFKNELIGGYLKAESVIRPFKKRDKTDGKLPDSLAFTSEVLQQEPRPAIMWEDIFNQFLKDTLVQGTGQQNPTYKTAGLSASTYYRYYGFDKRDYGGGTEEEMDSNGNLARCYSTVESGYTQGFWDVKNNNGTESAYAHWKPNDPKGGNVNTGELMLNYEYKSNVSVYGQFRLINGGQAGVRFGAKKPGNGFYFFVDTARNGAYLQFKQNGQIIWERSASLGDRVINNGALTTIRAMVNNGKIRCRVGNISFFNDVDISEHLPERGACGFYASGEVKLYTLNISSTEKWETMERMSVIVDGQTYTFGELPRPGITRDEYGYLNYSGLNEINIRGRYANGSYPTVSLDYVFFVQNLPAWNGRKEITIKLDDAGIWFKKLYIGDSEGMSITYCGDEDTFEQSMNMAVYDYGAKGVGLWTLGQADPRVLERSPDVVPWHDGNI